MDRRTYLRAAGVTGITAGAGCLGSIPGVGGDDGTALDPPGQSLSEASFPSHGDEMPAITLPDPLSDEEVSTADFEGERSYLLTFFYTSCPDGVCPALLLRLRRAQADSLDRGYDDDLALLAMTFDPERDTSEALRTYAGEQGVDLEAGNWHFLRPEDNEAAKSVVSGDLGVPLERMDSDDPSAVYDGDGSADGGGNESGGDAKNESGSDAGNDSDGGHGDHDHGEYWFTHVSLILLVNADGVVERAYPQGDTYDVEDLVSDVRTVVEG